MNKLRKKRLVDELIDAYVSWREACVRVSQAYETWARETGIGTHGAFAWYMEALDREESAADAYASLVRKTGQLVASERPNVAPAATRQ
jgi:hypothetical protein